MGHQLPLGVGAERVPYAPISGLWLADRLAERCQELTYDAAECSLFDDLVGAHEDCGWHSDAERFGSFEVED
jgi:hypothetical protein